MLSDVFVSCNRNDRGQVFDVDKPNNALNNVFFL